MNLDLFIGDLGISEVVLQSEIDPNFIFTKKRQKCDSSKGDFLKEFVISAGCSNCFFGSP